MNEEILKYKYDLLLESGFFWEFYPELTGYWKEDKNKFIYYNILKNKSEDGAEEEANNTDIKI